ncbi:MAG: hypothetical protein ACOCU4_04585 [Alkalispirochaeta sp.]
MTGATAQLRALLLSHRPGQIVTRTTLLIAMGRGAAGPPSDDLLVLVSDHDSVNAALTEDAALRRLVYRCGDGRFARRRWSLDEPRRGVLDLNNLVWTFRPGMGTEPPRVAPLFEVVRYLRSLSVARLIGIADANLAHTVTDTDLLSAFRDALDEMHTAPAGVPADELILTAAEDAAPYGGALIFSNDRFRQWRKSSPWRRRTVWRVLVPVRPPGAGGESPAERQFDLGDPGWELRDPPPDLSDR